ncbi:hypothetical protein [Bacillus sp. Cs-700]|uniref:hypothetical protein n=1 Tax=Bacillus sp. Cs-700 TaxID=2589818 RepID=UPI001F602341|nr:hypothetical protein [Bacillus sp. Cs-700]
MMDVFITCCGAIGFFLVINFFFSLLYMVSKTAGNGFYRWSTHDEFFILTLIIFPLFGLTQYTANQFYDKFNWFTARLMLILYAILVLILAISFFILFDYLISIT